MITVHEEHGSICYYTIPFLCDPKGRYCGRVVKVQGRDAEGPSFVPSSYT